jgi:Na+/proline symporter
MSTIDLLSFGGFVALLMGVGFFQARKVQTEAAYLFAERKTKWAALTATLVMTEFNSATLISFAGLGYAAGLWALILPCIFLIGLLFYAVTVSRKWKEYDGMSVAGFFTQRYGRDVGSFASILLMLAMLGFCAAYLKSLTLLFQPIFPNLNPWVVSSGLFLIVVAMTLRGGLLAIIRTDIVSLICMLLFFPGLAIYLGTSKTLPASFYPETFFADHILPLKFVFSLTILTMFTYILAPWYGQKIFSAANSKVACRSVIASAFLVFLLYGSAITATALFKYRGFEISSPDMALPKLINQCLPSGLKGLAYALLFTTSATTLTGVWSTMASMAVGDFMKETPGYRRTIWLTLGFALASLILANTLVDKVFDKLILANIPVAALSFGLLAGFYWKRASRIGVLASIGTGCFCGVFAYLIFGEEGGYTWYWAVFGIPLTFATGIVTSLLSPRPLEDVDLSRN